MNTAHPPLPYHLEASAHESFKVLLDEGVYFFTPFHFHRECQLTLVLEGTGTRVIGDSVERFGEGEVVLIGSNLPHVFRSDPHYHLPGSQLRARAISVFFNPDFLSELFWQQPETRGLATWIDSARRGIVFSGETRRRAAEELRRLQAMSPGFPRLLALLDLIYRLSRSQESRFLARTEVLPPFRHSDSHKLHKVFEFVMKNYQEEVRLEEAAYLASMTPAAFSRYFKRQTRRTFSGFVQDIRVGAACSLLLETDLPIGDVAFRSGFHNLSNFNRRFKEATGSTPRAYRATFAG